MEHLLNIVSCSIAFLALVSGIRSSKFHDPFFRFIFYQVILGFITEIIGGIYVLLHAHNMWIFNVYLLLSTPVLAVAGLSLIKNNYKKYLILFICIIWSMIWSIEIHNIGISKFANIAFMCTSIGLTLIYIPVLINVLINDKGAVFFDSVFITSIAIIIFYSCNIPGLSLVNYLITHYRTTATELFNITDFLSITYYLLVAYSFALLKKTKHALSYAR